MRQNLEKSYEEFREKLIEDESNKDLVGKEPQQSWADRVSRKMPEIPTQER